MRAITWKLGSEPAYDNLFEHLREHQYRDHEHPLWKNYGRAHFWEECAAVTIAFDSENVPVLGGSILKRTCWPADTYRIINRLWIVDKKPTGHIKNLMPEGEYLLRSQINWLNENTTCKLLFISRESEHWQKWTIKQYSNNYGLEFNLDSHQYQVCDNPTDASCWQRIIYQGDKELLDKWNRR